MKKPVVYIKNITRTIYILRISCARGDRLCAHAALMDRTNELAYDLTKRVHH